MTKYVNKTLGVINVGGQFAAPGKTLDVSDKSPGLDRLVKRGLLVKAGQPKQGQKQEEKADNKAE